MRRRALTVSLPHDAPCSFWIASEQLRIRIALGIGDRAIRIRREADADHGEAVRPLPADPVVSLGPVVKVRPHLPEIIAGIAPQCRVWEISDSIFTVLLSVPFLQRWRFGSRLALRPRRGKPLDYEIPRPHGNGVDLCRRSISYLKVADGPVAVAGNDPARSELDEHVVGADLAFDRRVPVASEFRPVEDRCNLVIGVHSPDANIEVYFRASLRVFE